MQPQLDLEPMQALLRFKLRLLQLEFRFLTPGERVWRYDRLLELRADRERTEERGKQ